MRPLRETGAQGPPQIRMDVVVHGEVEAPLPRVLPQRHHLGQEVGPAVLRGVVADLRAAAGALAYLDALPHRVHDALPLTPDVARVHPPVTCGDLRQRDDLIGLGEAAGRIHEPRGQAEGARAHGLLDACPHPVQLLGRRKTLRVPELGHPHVPVPDEGGDVHAHTRPLHRVQVLAERRPRVRDGVIVLRELLLGEMACRVGHRRGRDAAVARHVQRHPLADGVLGGGVLQDPDVAVRMDVDESRCHAPAFRFDHPERPRAREIPYGPDAIAHDADVGRARGSPVPSTIAPPRLRRTKPSLRCSLRPVGNWGGRCPPTRAGSTTRLRCCDARDDQSQRAYRDSISP